MLIVRKQKFTITVIAIMSAFFILDAAVQIVFAVNPYPGPWTVFLKGTSPTKLEMTVGGFIVGTVDSLGKLIDWKLGENSIDGTYDPTTGKLEFSVVDLTNNKTTFAGYFSKRCPDTIDPLCPEVMAGMWTEAPAKSQGWFAYFINATK
jgi:hypothetical protein